MKTVIGKVSSDLYESPAVLVCNLYSEGVLCASGTHDSFTEEDDWIEFLA